jgi:hypothetical protein
MPSFSQADNVNLDSHISKSTFPQQNTKCYTKHTRISDTLESGAILLNAMKVNIL